MHELAMACELVEIAEQAARAAHAQSVTTVRLRLGAFAGVEREALLFGYDAATRGTLLQGSYLLIEDVPLVVACDDCGISSQPPSLQMLTCPNCGSEHTHIISGQEIDIVGVEIVEHADALAPNP
jgi:hydrogenase nickel incorporation protein HypA/HybF